jgi:hypothetical protein
LTTTYVLVAAILPGLYWDKAPDPAVKGAGVERVFVPSAQLAAWANQGVAAVSVDPAKLIKLTPPGVQYRMNQAAATSVPWIDANGWRFLRDPKGHYYYDVPAAAVPLAMAESFAYGVAATLRATADLDAFGRMLVFLKRMDRPLLPTLANIGIIDDGTESIAEVMNLLSRRNLLFRVVKAPDPKLDLNLKPARDEAADPFAYSQKVRQKLGDDKRLVRIYGSDVVIAHLTGDAKTARLHLLNYSNRKVVGMRIRLRGEYAKATPAVFGIDNTTLMDYDKSGGATEFTLPEMGVYAVIDLTR